MSVEPNVDTAPAVSDEVRQTTCYMCACRCGINVHMRDGKIRYIEGNRDHPVNQGVLCAKGSAGIMQHYSPARLRKPLLRTGLRGKGEYREIEWDEALSIVTERLARIRSTDPKKLAFFTGRDQSQALTGWWASQFGTPNFAAHGGFCSVNMAAAGLYTIGGSFWEFGEPDWDRTKYFMMFGVAEDHDSNPIKIGLGKIKTRGAKFVSVNPVRSGYSAIADEWVGIRPGTDATADPDADADDTAAALAGVMSYRAYLAGFGILMLALSVQNLAGPFMTALSMSFTVARVITVLAMVLTLFVALARREEGRLPALRFGELAARGGLGGLHAAQSGGEGLARADDEEVLDRAPEEEDVQAVAAHEVVDARALEGVGGGLVAAGEVEELAKRHGVEHGAGVGVEVLEVEEVVGGDGEANQVTA